jgi:hypothetical protein
MLFYSRVRLVALIASIVLVLCLLPGICIFSFPRGSQAQFKHPNIVALIGVVTVGDPMMIVLEYMEHGSMQTYLKKFDINASQKKRFALVRLRFLYNPCNAGSVSLENQKLRFALKSIDHLFFRFFIRMLLKGSGILHHVASFTEMLRHGSLYY